LATVTQSLITTLSVISSDNKLVRKIDFGDNIRKFAKL